MKIKSKINRKSLIHMSNKKISKIFCQTMTKNKKNIKYKVKR